MTGSPLDVLVVGGCGIDYMVRADVLPSPGHSVMGDVFVRDVGGKGLNQAIAAARLGARAALISCVGDDPEGDEVLRALAKDGVDANAVVRVGDILTARTLIGIDTRAQKQTVSYPGANRKLRDEHLTSELLSRAKVALAQLEVPTTTVL
jgi:ribokinase